MTRSSRRSITSSARSLSRTRFGSTVCPARSTRRKNGLPRAYDAQLDAKTRLFVRGDDRYPTGNPLAPGVPESLGVPFRTKPVTLPLAAISPDRRAL